MFVYEDAVASYEHDKDIEWEILLTVECITCQYIVHKLYNIEMNYINKCIILLGSKILHTRIASEFIILNL